MFEIIVLFALLASVASGIWDLLTTEVPDQIPYAMVGGGVLYWGYTWLSTGDIQPFLISVVSGTFLLLLGIAMYKKGQWGAADAWVLAGIAYLLPVYNGTVFILPYLFNFIFVALAYVIVYSLYIGFRNWKIVAPGFVKDLEKHSRMILFVPVGTLALVLVASKYDPRFFGLWFLAPFLFVFLVLWRYAKVIENHVFVKKINTKDLRAGDVLQKNIWIGLTPGQVKKLKSSQKFVTIKDGVRFVPVFTITLIITLLEINLFHVIF